MPLKPSKLLAAGCFLTLTYPTAGAHQLSEQPTGAAVLHAMEDDDLGAYIVDGEEMSLYLFEADRQATGEAKAESACHEECALAWPPLLTEGEPEAHDPLDPQLLGTITRKNGGRQVTYNGWPLYHYAADYSAGHKRGHDIEEFGGEWYLISPDGTKVSDEH